MIYIIGLLLVVSIGVNVFLITSLLKSFERIEMYGGWILSFRKSVENTRLELKRIDEKQIFEKDDDVGFVFSNIVAIIDDLKTKTYVENQTENQDSENQTEDRI